MTRKRVPLRNFVTEYSVRNKNNEDIPVYSVTNSQGFCREYFGKEVASKDKTTYKIVPYGYFAYNPSRINVGSVDWQRCETQVIVSPLYNVFSVFDELDSQFLYYFLKSNIGRQMIRAKAAGSVRDNLKLDMLKEITIPESSLNDQRHCAATLDNLQHLIELRKKQLAELDNLIKARFVELFGDLKSNPMEWPVVPFAEFAKIDGNMTTDYEKYADYPHIGIDSIEKGTGALKGYRTVREDGVISGKYIFTPQHIIYSKIRPNLNKVALPDFEGLCSADAYPILPNHSNCNRVFLAIALRSEYFLEYILQFSSRTNLPKVNRKEITGFRMPLPPLKLQEQFAAFVEQTDKSKVAVQKALDEAQLLFDSLMQKYFG